MTLKMWTLTFWWNWMTAAKIIELEDVELMQNGKECMQIMDHKHIANLRSMQSCSIVEYCFIFLIHIM